MRVSGKKEENGGKKVFKDIMTNSFSELMKDTNARGSRILTNM